jgi:hypothetical protein
MIERLDGQNNSPEYREVHGGYRGPLFRDLLHNQRSAILAENTKEVVSQARVEAYQQVIHVEAVRGDRYWALYVQSLWIVAAHTIYEQANVEVINPKPGHPFVDERQVYANVRRAPGFVFNDRPPLEQIPAHQDIWRTKIAQPGPTLKAGMFTTLGRWFQGE